MKRSLFGVSLLVVLLILSLGVTVLMARIHEPIAEDLEQASELVAAGDWAGATELAKKAREEWKQVEPLSACFADHGPMEEINQEFAQLEAYEFSGEPMAFAAACSSLAEKMQAMSDAHGLQWRNLF